MSKIEYLTWSPEFHYETQDDAASACIYLDQTLDDYREEGDGWPMPSDMESLTAFVIVPICVTEEVAGEDNALEYETRDVNRGLLSVIEARAGMEPLSPDADIPGQIGFIMTIGTQFGKSLTVGQWAKIGALCAAAIDRAKSLGGGEE